MPTPLDINFISFVFIPWLGCALFDMVYGDPIMDDDFDEDEDF